MSVGERIIFLAIGVAIGFVLGYIVRALREVRIELEHKVDKDGGRIRNETLMKISLFLVVGLTAYSAFQSQVASNHVSDNQVTIQINQDKLKDTQDQLKDTQDRLERVASCTQVFLSETILALNQRTTYTVSQAAANVKLQSKQAAFFAIVLARPPVTRREGRAALQAYEDALTRFVVLAGKSAAKVQENPYPTNQNLQDCLNGK